MRSGVSVAVGQFEDLISIGLRHLLAEDPSVELVAEGVTLERLDATLDELEPAVALVDLVALPTPAVVHRLFEAHPQTRVVVLANRPSGADATQLLAFGAAACLPKDAEARDLITAIHLASRGMTMVPRYATRATPGPELLTAREADVLELLREGLANAEIAHRLSIGIETVRTHARSIYGKLGVGSRRELTRREPPSIAR